MAVLHPLKLATTGDYEALSKYCDIYAQWWAAREFIGRHGQTFPLKDEDGNVRCIQQFPQVSIYRNLLSVMQKYEVEFGMTPGARARMGNAAAEEKPTDPLDEFLKGQSFGQTVGQA